MSNTVYAVKEEANRARLVKPQVSSQVKPKNRLKQRTENNVFRETDVSLTKDLIDFFKNKTNLDLTSIKIHHSSKTLAKSIPCARYNEANGFTLVVFEFSNHPKLFSYSICILGDNFSRLEGRVYAKRRALNLLKLSLPKPVFDIVGNVVEYTPTVENYGLLAYPDHVKNEQKNPNSVTPIKIANWFVKNFIKSPVQKVVKELNPLSLYNEDNLLENAKDNLAKEHNIDPESVKLYTQYIRKYSNSLLNGLLGTPEWFKNLTDETKQLISNGGYTVYGIIGTNKDTGQRSIFVTYSRCSDEEGFEKSLGRKQCLINIINNKYDTYKYTIEIESISEALLNLFMQKHQLAVNCDRGSNTLKELADIVKK